MEDIFDMMDDETEEDIKRKERKSRLMDWISMQPIERIAPFLSGKEVMMTFLKDKIRDLSTEYFKPKAYGDMGTSIKTFEMRELAVELATNIEFGRYDKLLEKGACPIHFNFPQDMLSRDCKDNWYTSKDCYKCVDCWGRAVRANLYGKVKNYE